MQFPSRLRTLAPPLLALTLLASPFAALLAQTSGSVKSQSSSSSSGTATPQEAQPQKPPSLIDPAGPQISLQTSEALFDIGAALNACGYDAGIERSSPIRQKVRDQVNAATQASAEAQATRDQLCGFIRQHQLSDSSHDLSQYVSLALYVSPPPELTPSVGLTEMPPDSTQVVEILPLLRRFAQQIDLHYIWISDRQQYEAIVNSLHDSLSHMIVGTNAYLKMPATVGTDSRFAVVLEPLLDPGQTNARVYSSDYVVVTSPDAENKVRMDEIRHTYLHFTLEPLLYARASSMDRLLPVLKSVREAPLEYTFRSDIVSLVTECMIRAVEARTMETGIAPFKAPAVVRHSEFEAVERERHATEQKAEAVRQAAVKRSMEQGYVLTAYFYERLGIFEHEPQSLKETIGEMVYGMDVPAEMGRIKRVTFAQQNEGDVVRRSTRQLRGLDLAEMRLLKGDIDGASKLAHQALDQHTGDTARADFLLARCAVMQKNVADARHYFEETIRLGKDPRLLAWSHIYLGRMDDLEHSRDEAVAQYQQALVVRDGRVDTREAAEHGLKEPYGPPPGARHAEEEEDAAPDKDEAAPDSANPNKAAAPETTKPASPAGAAPVSPSPATPQPQQ
jgi:tetratricopeptide (TPR) repeat protein